MARAMATRGRKPTPTSLKVARNNPGKRAINREEPEVPAADLEPPAVLDGKAREKWIETAPQLHDCGLLTKIDTDALVGYCMTYERWFEAQKQLKLLGTVILSPSGYPMQSPYVSIADKALRAMQSFQAEFGMTPSSRSRVKVKKKTMTISEADRQRERFFGISGGRR